MENKFEPIARLLYKGSFTADRDSRLFHQYERGEVSLEDCIKDFLKHNGCEHKAGTFTPELFKEWLESLGYIRHEE